VDSEYYREGEYLNEMAICDKCDGTGFGFQHVAPWDGPSEPCAYCGGSGEVTDVQ